METQVRLLTIIAEDELEQRLLKDLETAGVRGYTISKVRGKGLHRTRGSEWEGENIMVQVLVSETVEQEVMRRLQADYFESYSVTVYAQNADVVRPSKYV